MKTIKIKGAYLKLYDSVDELPVQRFMQFNRFLFIDSQIGSDQEAWDAKANMLRQLIAKGETEKALQELINMQLCVRFIMQNISPKVSAFFALVHQINDHVLTDLSEENIQLWIKKLSAKKLRMSQVKLVIEELKKKWIKS